MTQAPGIERLALPDPARDIFLRTCLILDEHVTPHTPRAEGWKIGGGTILAARWRHRKSNDIDLLVEPGTETAFFQPASNPELTRLLTDAGATSLNFDRLSEIRFPTTRIEILAARPTPRLGHKNAIVDGHPATALASSQILTAKMLNRSLQPPVRDLYDFAIAERMDPRALAIGVNSLTPIEIMTRLLRWEVSKHDYAGDARIDIQNVPDVDGRPTPMRDWELLRLLNEVPTKGAATASERSMTTVECVAVVDRLGSAFESGLSDHAPSLHRPVCWPEMLFLPAGSGSSDARGIPERAATSTG